jgi:hypothetical protein
MNTGLVMAKAAAPLRNLRREVLLRGWCCHCTSSGDILVPPFAFAGGYRDRTGQIIGLFDRTDKVVYFEILIDFARPHPLGFQESLIHSTPLLGVWSLSRKQHPGPIAQASGFVPGGQGIRSSTVWAGRRYFIHLKVL